MLFSLEALTPRLLKMVGQPLRQGLKERTIRMYSEGPRYKRIHSFIGCLRTCDVDVDVLLLPLLWLAVVGGNGWKSN